LTLTDMTKTNFYPTNSRQKNKGFTPLEVLGRKIFKKIFMRRGNKAENKQTPPVLDKAFLSKRKLLTGFTILEVMAAIFILTIGIGGAFLLVRQSLSAASVNKNRLIAAYLAQEGIEIVRNIRDTNWLEKRTNPLVNWDDGLGSGDWRADYSTTTLSTNFVTNTAANYLKVDSNQMYNYTVGSPTSFQRKISLRNTDLSPADGKMEKEVRVTVFWSERGRTHSLSALEYLQNWYEK